jgi:hypothetical protein
MAIAFMEDVLGNTPYDWQKEVIGHMVLFFLSSMYRNGYNVHAPILLIRPTGGGKSGFRNVVLSLLVRI